MAPSLAAAAAPHTPSPAASARRLRAKHIVSGDMETTFSPLSSSSITIVSLGMSLSYDKHAPSRAKAAAAAAATAAAATARAPAKDADGLGSDSETSSEADVDLQKEDVQAARLDSAHSRSSANVSTAGSRTPADDPAAARSTSLDTARPRGLHILRTNRAAARSTPAVAKVTAPPAPEAPVPGLPAARAAPASDVRSAIGAERPTPTPTAAPPPEGPARSAARRLLASRILRPLSWRHSAAPAATAATADNVPAAAGRRIVSQPGQSAGATHASAASAADSAPSSTADSAVLVRDSEETCRPAQQPAAVAAAAAAAAARADAAPKPAEIGPARFQALSRSLGARLGRSPVLAERRRQQGDLRFVIAPHPLFTEVVEVYDCDGPAVPVYRKVSRSAKGWHETFHDVDPDAPDAVPLPAAPTPFNVPVMSDYAMAAALGLPYPALGLAGGAYSSAGSCVSFHSSSSAAAAAAAAAAAGRGRAQALDSPAATSNASTASLANAATTPMGRASTSMGFALTPSRGGAAPAGVPADKDQLWEARTPYPNQFPLHVKDSRKIIDTLSMASMVLDRHDFCYRFSLGSTRMRWVAKRARRHQLALHCLVRNTVVAEVFVDYEKGYSPYSALAAPLEDPAFASGCRDAPIGKSSSGGGGGAAVALPEDGSLPVVTILPAAFLQLDSFEEDVVESFVIFTGMQVLECLHI
ncbi:hypothetical protein H4R18_001229 [Coemansia javaensis]|uniref:Uncharacterized protein n=1 Tax=Coemansia javaensis TaxID=2761396 RepID=A0A9W8HLA3_9FUNG|nr:hypothetical protein H4R18_001229 [Coemansia javaensis]